MTQKNITIGLILLVLIIAVGIVPSTIMAQSAKKSSAQTPMKSFKKIAYSLEEAYNTLPRKNVPYRIYLGNSVVEVKPRNTDQEEMPAEASGACVCGGWSDTEGGPYAACGGCDCDPSGCGGCAPCDENAGTAEVQPE